MSNLLCYRVHELKGLSLTDNAILFQIAFAVPKDGDTVNMALETLAYRAKCNIRTAQRSLRRLEKSHYLIPTGEKGGRGNVLKYIVNVAAQSVEEVPVKPPEELPPTNGHNGYKPPALPDRKDGLTAYRDPLARRADETAMEYARRVDRRGT